MRKSLLIAAIAVVAVAVGMNTVLARSHRSEVVCKLVGEKRVVCPDKKLRGPRGERGRQGPQGPPGGGFPIDNSLPLTYTAPANSPSERVIDLPGARIDASCNGSGEITATVTMTADDNIVQLTNVADGTHVGDRDADTGESFNLALGGAAEDATRQLVHMSASGVVSTASYGVADGGSECALFGVIRQPSGTP